MRTLPPIAGYRDPHPTTGYEAPVLARILITHHLAHGAQWGNLKTSYELRPTNINVDGYKLTSYILQVGKPALKDIIYTITRYIYIQNSCKHPRILKKQHSSNVIMHNTTVKNIHINRSGKTPKYIYIYIYMYTS